MFVLDRFHPVVFHVLDDAGILFDALYPAFALLLGGALNLRTDRLKWPSYATGLIALGSAIACGVILWKTRDIAATGDIARAMNYQVSTLSLGKAQDLTLTSMAWLRAPLIVACCALLGGTLAAFIQRGRFAVLGFALMMAVMFNAARLALVTLNPYFGSRPLAEALRAAPPGQLIVDDQYYAFSSVFFYANRTALLLNGRKMNLDYGSYAPGAPNVFLTDDELPARWMSAERHYLTAAATALPRLTALVGRERMHLLRASGGKLLLTNQPLPTTRSIAELERPPSNLK